MVYSSKTPNVNLKAQPKYELAVGTANAVVFTATALISLPLCLGFDWLTAILAGFVLIGAAIFWFPLAALITYLNRPDAVMTAPDGVAVKPTSAWVKPRIVPWDRCRWYVDEHRRVVLRLFPFHYSLTKAGWWPHRLVLDLPDAQRDAWIETLQLNNAPKITV